MAKHITYRFSVEAVLPLTEDPTHPDFYVESVATSVKFRADLERAMLTTLRRFEAEVVNLEILDFTVEDDGTGQACALCDRAHDSAERCMPEEMR